MSKYGVIFGPYFPVFGLNTEKYRPEITPYLDTFHAVLKSKLFAVCLKVIYSNGKHSFYESSDMYST